jgi:hypothetical protein
MPGVVPGVPEVLRAFTQTGHLPPGEWFVAPRSAGRFTMFARGYRWDDRITDTAGWRPVGGPLVGARMQYGSSRDGIYMLTDYWLQFDQEVHPFGRFDLAASSIAYQDPESVLRLYVPLPAPRDRVSVQMIASFQMSPCEAYLPGVWGR